MITDFAELQKYLVDYDTFLCHSSRDYSNYKDINGKLLYTTFITYNKETNKISGNKVSRIICTDVHHSLKSSNIVFCAPADDLNEKLPTTHGIWYESSSVDMMKWEIPVFKTYAEAEAHRKKMYKTFRQIQKQEKIKDRANTVTLEQIADKFCISVDDLIIEGVWNDRNNKKRKK